MIFDDDEPRWWLIGADRFLHAVGQQDLWQSACGREMTDACKTGYAREKCPRCREELAPPEDTEAPRHG